MTGCASPVRLYHEAEGGDIATLRQPPPGSDLPYPNLASVPPAPAVLTASEQQAVQAQLSATRPAPASPEALAGLTLPASAPPLPNVPGINWQGLPTAPAPAPAAPPAPTVVQRPDGPPILLAFPPKSALLSAQAQTALKALAQARGSAKIRAGGFGGQSPDLNAPDAAALTLALYRARRIADALTAAGVPAAEITLVASAAGSGGFAQLVY
jgi:outer membrane protein OmpA-like peptidoglycan-associated protein